MPFFRRPSRTKFTERSSDFGFRVSLTRIHINMNLGGKILSTNLCSRELLRSNRRLDVQLRTTDFFSRSHHAWTRLSNTTISHEFSFSPNICVSTKSIIDDSVVLSSPVIGDLAAADDLTCRLRISGSVFRQIFRFTRYRLSKNLCLLAVAVESSTKHFWSIAAFLDHYI